MKPKEEKDGNSSPSNGDGDIKIKTETDDNQLKHTEDSTALKNAILGPQPAEPETPATVATESIPTVHGNKTDTASSGKYNNYFSHVFRC